MGMLAPGRGAQIIQTGERVYVVIWPSDVRSAGCCHQHINHHLFFIIWSCDKKYSVYLAIQYLIWGLL